LDAGCARESEAVADHGVPVEVSGAGVIEAHWGLRWVLNLGRAIGDWGLRVYGGHGPTGYGLRATGYGLRLRATSY
jgi:hypothetical protein